MVPARTWRWIASTLVLLGACDAREVALRGQGGTATGTTAQECAALGWTGLTYSGFAAAFFTTYCTACHASTVVGASRNGAPPDHNFDSLAGARLFADHIDRMAGASPSLLVKNTFMPPAGPTPTDHERQQLSCWIAGGAPP